LPPTLSTSPLIKFGGGQFWNPFGRNSTTKFNQTWRGLLELANRPQTTGTPTGKRSTIPIIFGLRKL
jgi:hypothetical protein